MGPVRIKTGRLELGVVDLDAVLEEFGEVAARVQRLKSPPLEFVGERLAVVPAAGSD